MEINFNTNIVEPNISDSILNLLPSVNNTLRNQMFFDSSINELFKKGSGVKINGYIGNKLNWYNSSTDFYINEISSERNFYQLEPTMTVNIDNEYVDAVYFTDYVDNLKSNGALTDNQNRLFSEKYYTLSLPINYDMFFNYKNYYVTSEESYICINTSDNENPWKSEWTTSTSSIQATRPIICFNNLQLYNYGEYRRSDIDLIDSTITDLSILQQKASITVGGNTYTKNNLSGKLSVLFTNIQETTENNIVYEIYFDNGGLSIFNIRTDGMELSGAPSDGEILKCGNTEYFYKNGSWNVAQSKTKTNQAPLFMLYDENGIELDDATTYPLSTFAGSKIFSYSEDETESHLIDSVLGMYLNYDSNGSTLFDNNIEKEVYSYNNGEIIDSTYFYANVSVSDSISLSFQTCWSDSGTSSQKVNQIFTYDGTDRLISLSSESFTNLIVNISKQSETESDIIVTSELLNGTDYLVKNNQILIKDISVGDIVSVSYSATTFTDDNIFYDYPLSLTCNPDFKPITELSFSDLQYFNKESFPKKSEASMLLEMLLVSDDKINVLSSIKYCSDQYRSYMFKFISKITEYASSGLYNDTSDIDTVVDSALKDITRGLTPRSVFYNSGVGVSDTYTQDYFIPPTPSFLGLYNVYEPEINVDYTTKTQSSYIYCHDGSMILSYGDFRDNAILNLQNRIFLSIKDEFKSFPIIDVKEIVSNVFHSFEYSYSEYCSVMEQFFISWCYDNNVTFETNTTYDKENPFTYNWSSMTSWVDNTNLLGGWRGIYKYFYGTDRPHTHPWECLGYSIKPDYWDSVYGPAPYTSGNKKLWGDINDGIIDSLGTSDSNRTRYNSIHYCPVDVNGNLLDPVGANLLGSYPNDTDAADTWSFGDGSPIETVWNRSSEYPFAVISTLYLLKPSLFINKCWDTEKTVNKTSLVYDRNIPYQNQYVHTETNNDNVEYKYGLQQFIVYNLIGNSYSVSEYLGNKLRGLNVNLAHRMGGFTDSNNLTVNSDSYGLIPDEDVNVILYNSPINENIQYSAVLIVKEGVGWKIYGYDQASYGFKTFDPDTGSIGFNIEVSNVSEYRTTYWAKNTSYVKNQIVSHNNKTYSCNSTHTSGQFFETAYWTQVSDTITNTNSVKWYEKYNSTNIKIIPFGNLYSSHQDISNLMCGLELYHLYNNISFEQDNNSHWYDCMKEFMLWDQTANPNDFILLSPLSNNITMDYGFGNVLNIEELYDGKWPVINSENKNITYGNVIRTASSISITSDKNDICGCNFYKNTIEHILILDNKTIFDDIIYSPELNLRQKRFYIQGYTTSNWTGRLSASGFIISGNLIVPNFDTCADNFRHIYDIESVEYDDLQQRGRANVGFYESSTLSNLLIQPTNQFEIYQSVIQNKGTASAFNRLLRSSVISTYEDISFYEEWAFRVGVYGAVSNFKSLDIFVRQSDIKNDSQVIEFNTETVHLETDNVYSTIGSGTFNCNLANAEVISAIISITDYDPSIQTSVFLSSEQDSDTTDRTYIVKNISENIIGSFNVPLNIEGSDYLHIISSSSVTIQLKAEQNLKTDISETNNIVITDYLDSNSNIVELDDRWTLRQFDSNTINFSKKEYNLNHKSFLKTAGYVNLDTIKWTATNQNAFESLYQSVYSFYGCDETTVSETFTLNSDISLPYTEKLISSVSDGYIRINKIEINVTSVFQLPITLNIGTTSQLPNGTTNNYSSTVIERITSDKFENVGTYTIYPSEILYMDGEDNDVYLQVSCMNDIPVGVDLGSFTITMDVQYVSSKNIKPNDRVWVYDINNSWMTYKLIDTGLKIYDIVPNLKSVPVVSFDSGNTDSLKTDGTNIVLSGTNGSNSNLDNIVPIFSNTTSTLITGDNTSTPIYYMNVNAGMNIKNFSINIIQPFYTTDGSDLTFEIGDVQNVNYIADSYVLSNPAPTTPSLSSVNPITVQAFNTNIVVLNGTPVIDVYVTRSGNFFGKVDSNGNVIDPTACGNTVTTSFEWNLYDVDSSNNIGTTSYDSGSFAFLNPDDASSVTSDPDYWMATIEVTVPENGNYAFVITSVTGGACSQSTTMIEMVGSSSTTYNLFDPTKIGIQNIDPQQFNNTSNNGNVIVTLGDNTVGSAVINVEYEYSSGFEISGLTQSGNTFYTSDNETNTTSYVRNNIAGIISNTSGTIIKINDNTSTSYDSSYVYGGNIFAWIPTRFKTVDDFNAVQSLYSEGDYIEIDNINNLWNICQYDGTNLNPIITQSELIETKLIQSAYLYNVDTKIIEEYLDIYDPMKGFILGTVREYLDYVSNNNPAIYNKSNFSNIKIDNDNVWADDHVGEYWWNTRTSPYLVYEMDGISNDYRIKHWGKFCPGVSVDVYQWVKSPVTPSQFESYVNSDIRYEGFDSNPSGTIDSEISYSWVEKTEWNKITNLETNVYYFWVKNPTTSISKSKTAYVISNELQNPDVSTFSVIDNNKVIISGVKDFITDNNTTLKINWKLKNTDSNFHKEWTLLAEGYDSIPDMLWNKMKESCVGYGFYSNKQTITTTLLQDFKATDTIAYIDTRFLDVNEFPIDSDIKIGNVWFTYGTIVGSKIYGITQKHSDILKGTEVNFVFNQPKIVSVPDQKLTSYDQIGNMIRPSQSWFGTENGLSSRSARKILVKYLNQYFKNNAVIDNWYENISIFNEEDNVPSENSYQYTVNNISDLKTFPITTSLNYGDCVLVTGNDSSNFWSLWAYQPYITSDNGGFNLISYQKWRLQEGELWSYVDWYSSGYSKSNYPIYIFKDINERDSTKIDVTLLYGTLVQVNEINSSDKRWTWYIYDGETWTTVARQNATIVLSDSFYKNTYVHGIDPFDYKMIPFRDGTYELDTILSSLRSVFMTAVEQNELFFQMVKFAISNSEFNDWVFKTSLLDVGGFIEQFNQRPVIVNDKTSYVEDFINEYKPYHVKIRDIQYGYTNGYELDNVHVSDFDFPVYYDSSKNSYRVLKPYMGNTNNNTLNNYDYIDGDLKIVENNVIWSDWYNNFFTGNDQYFLDNINTYTDNWNPVRRTNISLIFDRKQCYSNYGWDSGDWDTSAYWLNPNLAIDTNYTFFISGIGNGNSNVGSLPVEYDNAPIIMYPSYLTSDDYKKFRPDVYGGYKDDCEVTYYRELMNIGINKNIMDGTIVYVKEIQQHFVLVRNIFESLYKDTMVLKNWTIFNETFYDKPASNDLSDYFQYSDLGKLNITWANYGDFIGSDMMYETETLKQQTINFCWLPYVAQGWDAPFFEFDGAAARITQSYTPTSGMIENNIPELMNGCGYNGDYIDGGDFSTTEYDSEILPKMMDTDGIKYSSDITLFGGNISNPYTSQYNTPEEACNIMVRDRFTINVYDLLTNVNSSLYDDNIENDIEYILDYRFTYSFTGDFKAYDFANILKNYSKFDALVPGSESNTNAMIMGVIDSLGLNNFSIIHFDPALIGYNGSVNNSYFYGNDLSIPTTIDTTLSYNVEGIFLKNKGFSVNDVVLCVPNKEVGYYAYFDKSYNVDPVKGDLPFLCEENFDDIYNTGMLNNIGITLDIFTPEDIEKGISDMKKDMLKERLLSEHRIFWNNELITFTGYEDITFDLIPDFSLYSTTSYEGETITDDTTIYGYVNNNYINTILHKDIMDKAKSSFGVSLTYTCYKITGITRYVDGTSFQNENVPEVSFYVKPETLSSFLYSFLLGSNTTEISGVQKQSYDNSSILMSIKVLDSQVKGYEFDKQGNGFPSPYISFFYNGNYGFYGLYLDFENKIESGFLNLYIDIQNVNYSICDASVVTEINADKITIDTISYTDYTGAITYQETCGFLGTIPMYYITPLTEVEK